MQTRGDSEEVSVAAAQAVRGKGGWIDGWKGWQLTPDLTGEWTVGGEGGCRSPGQRCWWPDLRERWGHTAGFQLWLENRATAEQGLGLQIRSSLVTGASGPRCAIHTQTSRG